MKKIFKYELPVEGQSILIFAHVFKWLKVDNQNGTPVVWAIIDDEKEQYKYRVESVGTGWCMRDELIYGNIKYLGSTTDWNNYVWHYFVNMDDEVDKVIKTLKNVKVVAEHSDTDCQIEVVQN